MHEGEFELIKKGDHTVLIVEDPFSEERITFLLVGTEQKEHLVPTQSICRFPYSKFVNIFRKSADENNLEFCERILEHLQNVEPRIRGIIDKSQETNLGDFTKISYEGEEYIVSIPYIQNLPYLSKEGNQLFLSTRRFANVVGFTGHPSKKWTKFRIINIGSKSFLLSEELTGSNLGKELVELWKKSEAAYQSLVKAGVSKREARYVLPDTLGILLSEWVPYPLENAEPS